MLEPKNHYKYKIGISGSYGGMNLGDEAILEGVLSQLRASVDADITVFSRNPTDTMARHQVECAVAVRDMTRKESALVVKELDLLILGGGGILYDHDAQTYLREVFLAHENNVPVAIYAVSAGPLNSPTARKAVQEALSQCALITVRDRNGYRLLEDVGVTRDIHLTADPALLLEPEEVPIDQLRVEGLTFDRPVVGFSVREPGPAAPHLDPMQYHALIASAADFVIERFNADVVFVPMELSDVQHSHAVIGRMQNPEAVEVLRRRYSPRQIMDIIGHFQLAVGMRLHFLIFAALRGTPLTALPYASKVAGLLDSLDMPMPPIGEVESGRLLATIDKSWDTRGNIRDKINGKLPPLIERARQTNKLLLNLLKG